MATTSPARKPVSLPPSPIRRPEPALRSKKSFSYFLEHTSENLALLPFPDQIQLPQPATLAAKPQSPPVPDFNTRPCNNDVVSSTANGSVSTQQRPQTPLSNPAHLSETVTPVRRVSPISNNPWARHMSPPAPALSRPSSARSVSRESASGPSTAMPTIPEMPQRPAPAAPPCGESVPLVLQLGGACSVDQRSPTRLRSDPFATLTRKLRQRASHATIATTHSSSSDENNSSCAASDRSSRSSHCDSQDMTTHFSTLSLYTDLHPRGRLSFAPPTAHSEHSPLSLSPSGYGSRSLSTSPSRSDLLNVPYSQQMLQHSLAVKHPWLNTTAGHSPIQMDTRTTLDMYRDNAKKTNDPAVQYEFAVFLVNAAQAEQAERGSLEECPMSANAPKGSDSPELLREAKQVLQRLADLRSYPLAQYYLADGFASGLFNNGRPDNERAFALFVSAAKHGHAEAGYRAALCYEYGWGCRTDYPKAVQFYRQSATKSHPGAATRLGRACLANDLGLSGYRGREGVKWLKRASESADAQHNAGPFELGTLHVDGYGDDVFKDEAYAAQLFTRAAELGHPEACLRMGQAYEHGVLTCPRDPALSLHFYGHAAQAGIPEAMMAMCAWCMVGAEPVLRRDEAEAYEWARKAAEAGLPKAQYAAGYFSEQGIGCQRDAIEAHVWYVRAADQGEARAKQRLAIIHAEDAGGEPAQKLVKKRSFFRMKERTKNSV